MKKIAFITGITGQDGSYLAELLLEKGYDVHGLIRPSNSPNLTLIEHLLENPQTLNPQITLHYGDLLDSVRLMNLIRHISPSEIYNLAAQSHVHYSFDNPQYTANVNAIGTVALLEAIKQSDCNIRFYQASTSEIFGSTPPPQNERSPFTPRSPYAAAKLMAYWITTNYRESYGIHASNGILFNHESPRRSPNFVTRKISLAVASIKNGVQKEVKLGNLDAIRDWGYAKEYVEGMWKMLQEPDASDYVLATGVGSTVREFADVAFSHVGLDWREYVKLDAQLKRPSEVDAIIGDSTKVRERFGWQPKILWQDLAKMMVEADMEKFNSKRA